MAGFALLKLNTTYENVENHGIKDYPNEP